jgi:hypothetical protein
VAQVSISFENFNCRVLYVAKKTPVAKQQGITAAGTVAASHGIPFSDCTM